MLAAVLMTASGPLGYEYTCRFDVFVVCAPGSVFRVVRLGVCA